MLTFSINKLMQHVLYTWVSTPDTILVVVILQIQYEKTSFYRVVFIEGRIFNHRVKNCMGLFH